MTQTPSDSFTIQSIHADARNMVLVVNINGATYPQVVPILTVQDPAVLTAQLQALAQQMRSEFAALTATVQASDATNPPVVADAVNALVGQSLPVDAPAPTPPPASS